MQAMCVGGVFIPTLITIVTVIQFLEWRERKDKDGLSCTKKAMLSTSAQPVCSKQQRTLEGHLGPI